MKWIWKQFSELTTSELYQVIQLRERIFVVEQNCVYLDCDGNDPRAWHLLGFKDDELVAYLRAFQPGVKYDEASVGRVVTSSSARGTGVGRELMKVGIEKTKATFATSSIRISAQAYLEKFYASLGFQSVGEKYLEDNIPHIEMVLP
jgi:ElaA protein